MGLEGVGWLRGVPAIDAGNFPAVFGIITLMSLSSALIFAGLKHNAGASLVKA